MLQALWLLAVSLANHTAVEEVVSAWEGTSHVIDASGSVVGRISQEHGILQRVSLVSTGGKPHIERR